MYFQLAALGIVLISSAVAPSFVHHDPSKQHALRALLFSYVFAFIAIWLLISAGYDAIVNGIALLGVRPALVILTFNFSDSPILATCVLALHLAGSIGLAFIARECRMESRVWLQ
jgi:hypothetical protein